MKRDQTTRGDTLCLSVAETATRLGISKGLAYRLVREGDIPSIELGSRLLVPRQRLERMLASAPRSHARA